MKTSQIVIKSKEQKTKNLKELSKPEQPAQLGFVFGSVDFFENQEFIKRLYDETPGVQWVGCSTAGEVSLKGVTDSTAVATTLRFENPKTQMKIACVQITSASSSFESGKKLAEQLKGPGLKSLILLSPGVNVNGSMVVKGIADTLGEKVLITGGLAGDEAKFVKTYTLSPKGVASDQLIGVGLYGDGIEIQYGCQGGWDAFGKVRKVTKSEFNMLYELDGKPALDIYKEYLGAHAKELPASGLMFPFEMLKEGEENSGKGLIRTILGVDDKEGSLTMAGNIEQGSQVRLMHANTAGLVSGARGAAEQAMKAGEGKNSFAMIVSCVGRKLVMGANVDEEVESIAEIFGPNCMVAGFYSYGEISPHAVSSSCELHNQTMTITYMYEKES